MVCNLRYRHMFLFYQLFPSVYKSIVVSVDCCLCMYRPGLGGGSGKAGLVFASLEFFKLFMYDLKRNRIGQRLPLHPMHPNHGL